MSDSHSTPPNVAAVRWFARIGGVLLVGFLGLFVVGHGGPPNVLALQGPEQLEFLGVAMIALGVLVGWWRNVAGGILSLAGFALFCAVEFAVNGAAPGGVFPLFCLPGVSLILAGLLGPRSSGRVCLD
jgi:hypothetical protein